MAPGSGLSLPHRVSLAPLSHGWASWQCSPGLCSPGEDEERIRETAGEFHEKTIETGLFSCIHSLIQQILVCIYYASGTVLGTEDKTTKIITVSARL